MAITLVDTSQIKNKTNLFNMDRMESQRMLIQNWLLNGKSITPIEALNKFGAFRLSAIIYRLKYEYNMPIATEMVYEEGGKRYARYYLLKDE